MYFGSVKFFKHLITIIIILVTLGLLIATISLAVVNGRKAKEIEELSIAKFALQALHELSNQEEIPGDPPTLPPLPDNTLHVEEDPVPDENIPEAPEVLSSPYSHLFPHLYSDYKAPEQYRDDTGYVYLTFDDGPSVYTHNILMYLDKHDVKATFFVMPDDTENGRNFLNHMLDNGHQIGIHCMDHRYSVIYADVEAYLEDFSQAWNLVYEQTGYKPYLFRFPGGSINDFNYDVREEIIAEMTRRGFVYFDWNVDSRDAMDANWSQMWNSVLTDVENVSRAVVLFHDRPGGYNTVLVIEDIIKELITRGYTLSPILEDTRPMQF